MFTGIIEGQAAVVSMAPRGQAYRLTLDLGALADDVKVGDSVAVNGTCLTAVTLNGARVEFDVIRETVERTSFAAVRAGDSVNVERSMRAGDRFHGHIVSGHIDGVGAVAALREEPGQTVLTVKADAALTTFMVEKGSICLDGVSLTLTAVGADSFSVALIPLTLEVTTLGKKTVGSPINVEVDQLGKWIHRLLGVYVGSGEEGAGLSLEDLRRSGFGMEGAK
jgi:riboflavin synthase